eukprot:10469101-Alexandrium_andersonii.AAC.1
MRQRQPHERGHPAGRSPRSKSRAPASSRVAVSIARVAVVATLEPGIGCTSRTATTTSATVGPAIG